MSAIKVERSSDGWTATICIARTAIKIFANSETEALRKAALFAPRPPHPTIEQTVR
jgi:hypothetical protein